MELSRRDALAALAATGASVAGGCAALRWGEGGTASGDADGTGTGRADADVFATTELEALVAVARTVYPSAVSGVPAFVETYSVGRVRDRPAYRAGISDAVAALDDYATAWYDARFAALDPGDRDALLREMDVDAADPLPDGDAPERVRHYLVNELLYALYTTPTGARLVGIENPQGFPGGTTSYRRPPPGDPERGAAEGADGGDGG